jgi:hypothetical protein
MTAAPASAVNPPQSQPSRIVNTFIAPGRAFAGLRDARAWWMAWLLIAATSILFFYAIDMKIGMDQVMQQEFARNTRASDRMERIPPEQKAQVLQRAAGVSRVIGYAAPVTSLVIFLAIAGVLAATFNFGLGAEVPYGVALAITVYGMLPQAIKNLLGTAALMLGANTEGFNLHNPVASNPAAFLDPAGSKFLYTICTGLDLFTLWSVVLLGIGFAAQSKIRRSLAVATVAACLVVMKLVQAAWAVFTG